MVLEWQHHWFQKAPALIHFNLWSITQMITKEKKCAAKFGSVARAPLPCILTRIVSYLATVFDADKNPTTYVFSHHERAGEISTDALWTDTADETTDTWENTMIAWNSSSSKGQGISKVKVCSLMPLLFPSETFLQPVWLETFSHDLCKGLTKSKSFDVCPKIAFELLLYPDSGGFSFKFAWLGDVFPWQW